MKNIEVKILNTEAITDAERMLVAMARMTQRAHKITNMNDFEELLKLPYSDTTVESMTSLPHPTLQKFGLVNVAIVGASRRFLAQITRHQNEVKFMSGSLQYSDYTGAAQFVVPYEVTRHDAEARDDCDANRLTDFYLTGCQRDLEEYEYLAKLVGNDAAGYKMPQGLRNVLLISALPFEWSHIISQRICSRNTLETQYTALLCWEVLIKHSVMFDKCGPSCIQQGKCAEGNMSCKHFLHDVPVEQYMYKHNCSLPRAILDTKFSLIREVYTND